MYSDVLSIEAVFSVQHVIPALNHNDKTTDLGFCVSPYVWLENDENTSYLGVRRESSKLGHAVPHFRIPAKSSKDPAAEVKVSFPMPKTPTGGLFGFHVFSYEKNHDGATGYMSLGHAKVDIHLVISSAKNDSHRISILDLDGKVCGSLIVMLHPNEAFQIDSFPTCSCKSEEKKTDAMSVFLKHHEDAIKTVFDGYKVNYSENMKNIFTFFVSPSHPLPRAAPILAFVALSRKFYEVMKSPDGSTFPFLEEAVPLLSYWAKIAEIFYVQCRPNPATQSLPVRRANILSEFLTLPFRGMIYSLDTVERENFRTRLTDQWIQLLNFPSLGQAFYDCEDGSLLVLQLYSMLYNIAKQKNLYKKIEKQDATLYQVIKMAMKYQAFFAICELGSENSGYTAHATVLFLPQKHFKKAYNLKVADRPFITIKPTKNPVVTLDVEIEVKFGDKDVPSIIAESTTYIDGAMVPTSETSDDEPFFTDYETFRKPSWTFSKTVRENQGINISAEEEKTLYGFANVKSLKKGTSEDDFDKENGLAWVRRVRDRASMEMVLKRKVFRNLFCLMSPFAEQYTNKSENPAKFEYYLLFQKTNGKYSYGASLETFLKQGASFDKHKQNGINLVRCGHISESDISGASASLDLHEILRDFPIGSFPDPPSPEEQKKAIEELERVVGKKENLVYYTRSPLDPKETSLLQLMMSKYHKDKPYKSITIPLAKGLSTTAFYESESVSSGA